MSDDVLITPASRKIEFKDSAGNIDGVIQLDSNGNLVLTSSVGLLIGDLDADIHIGDGSNVVDMVFDFAGSIYSAANQDLTIGKSSLGGNDIIIDSPNWSVTSAGNATFAGDLTIAEGKHIYFDSTDTFIKTNTDNPEDLFIAADEDIFLRPDDDLYIQAGTTTYATFDGTNQRLGIGTTTPSTLLHLSASDPVLKITDTTGSDNRASLWLQESDSYGVRLAYESSGNDFFNLNTIDGGTETTRMVVDRYGKMGIGTTTPDQLLDVEGSDGFTKIGYTGATMPAGIHSRVVNKNLNSGVPHWLFETVHDPTVDRDNEIFRIHGNETGDNHVFRVTTQGSTASPTHEALAILKDGKVGIGTTSPGGRLHVEHDATTGHGLKVYSNKTASTMNSPLALLHFDSVYADEAVLHVVQDGPGDGIYIESDVTAPSIAPLRIRTKTTIGTVTGHIMLTGDSATDGQGPQVVFSESGSGSDFAGAYVGYARTGSNGMGDLIFATRQSSGDASTVPTEVMRLKGGGVLNAVFAGGIETTSSTNGWNTWSMMRFGKLDYGNSAGGGSGLSSFTFDDNEAGFGSVVIPTNITIRAVQIRTNGVVLANSANKADPQVMRIFANGQAGSGTLTNINYDMEDFTRQNSENANATAHYYTVTGLSATYNAGDTMSIRRESGGYDMGDVIVDIYYSMSI